MTCTLSLRGVTSHSSTRTCHRATYLISSLAYQSQRALNRNVQLLYTEPISIVLLSCCLTSNAPSRRAMPRLPSRAFSAVAPPQPTLQASVHSEWKGKLHHKMFRSARSSEYIPWLSGFAEVAWRFPSSRAWPSFPQITEEGPGQAMLDLNISCKDSTFTRESVHVASEAWPVFHSLDLHHRCLAAHALAASSRRESDADGQGLK